MKKLFVAFICGLVSVPSFGGILDIETSYSASPVVTTRRARGHFGAEEHLFSGDVLGGLAARGRGLTTWATTAGVGIYLKANQDWTASAQGTKITFETTPDDSTTPAEVMSIDDNGNVNISGNLIVTGTTSGSGDTSNAGTYVATPTTYIIGGGTLCTPTSEFALFVTTGTGAIDWQATPSIATTTATNGQVFEVMHSTTTDLTINDNDGVAGTLIELLTGAATVVLSAVGDVIKFRYYEGVWYETSRTLH